MDIFPITFSSSKPARIGNLVSNFKCRIKDNFQSTLNYTNICINYRLRSKPMRVGRPTMKAKEYALLHG